MYVVVCAIIFLLISNVCATLIPREDYDYVWIEDLPLQDGRLVRADGSDGNASSNITTENPFVGRSNNNDQDWTWLQDALRDIAYYLRSHKFNEYDRRYETDESKASKEYHKGFPRPPLRSLHWEVKKYCEISFLNCVEFLWKRVREADLKRSDDTSVVIHEQNWRQLEHSVQIASVESECKISREKDKVLGNPFQGPLEKFQWRTTASYYMCWYTMHQVPDLAHLNEKCDNFANCLDPQFGHSNKDFRANDNVPFLCSQYSFCPDPCCLKRHQQEAVRCWESPENPCYVANPAGQRECVLNRTRNTDFRDIVLNHWNVTCHCPLSGFVWDSSYGICVDVDECFAETHTCKKSAGEACLNTVGSYRCVCKWGYTWSTDLSSCSVNDAIAMIKMTKLVETTKAEEIKEKSLIRRLFKKIFMRNTTEMCCGNVGLLLTTCLLVLFIQPS